MSTELTQKHLDLVAARMRGEIIDITNSHEEELTAGVEFRENVARVEQTLLEKKNIAIVNKELVKDFVE